MAQLSIAIFTVLFFLVGRFSSPTLFTFLSIQRSCINMNKNYISFKNYRKLKEKKDHTTDGEISFILSLTSRNIIDKPSLSYAYSDASFYEHLNVTDDLNAKPFSLPMLPWDPESISNHISTRTVEYHYGKHHAGYLRELNKFVANDQKLQNLSIEEIIGVSDGAVYNNAAQYYNHIVYWNSISPNGGGEPTGKVADMIKNDYGSFHNFKTLFTDISQRHFGSGWIWLVFNKDSRKLDIISGNNAFSVANMKNLRPLLALDVWEHSYYLDYQNRRASYISAWFELVNWEFAHSSLELALQMD